MFKFYSFQVPVFCGVIWILSNSFMGRKSTAGWADLDVQGKVEELHYTVQNKTSTLLIHFIFLQHFRVGSCNVKKQRDTESFFSCLVRLQTKSSGEVYSLLFSIGLSPASLWTGDVKKIRAGITHASSRRTACACIGVWFFFVMYVCDFIKLAYFTQCLQRCMLW